MAKDRVLLLNIPYQVQENKETTEVVIEKKLLEELLNTIMEDTRLIPRVSDNHIRIWKSLIGKYQKHPYWNPQLRIRVKSGELDTTVRLNVIRMFKKAFDSAWAKNKSKKLGVFTTFKVSQRHYKVLTDHLRGYKL